MDVIAGTQQSLYADSGFEMGGGNTDVILTYGGGGGGGGSAYNPPIDKTAPAGTVNSDFQNLLNISSNIPGASIVMDGELTYKVTPERITNLLSDIILKGGKRTITVEKEGYTTDEQYIINVINNPDYIPIYGNFNINPASSIFGGMSGNTGVSGLSFGFGSDISYSGYNNSNWSYTNTPPYKFRVQYYNSGVVTNVDYESVDQIQNLSFTLVKKSIVVDEPALPKYKVTVTSDTSDRVLVIKNNTDSTILSAGVASILGDDGDTLTISSNDLLKYRISKIEISSTNRQSQVLEANSATDSLELDSLSAKITLDADYNIVVTTEPVFVPTKAVPSIELTNPNYDRIYNINTKADIPIGIKGGIAVEKVTAYVNNEKFTFDKLFDGSTEYAGIIIPAKVFTIIGNYKIILVPSNSEGDGSGIELFYNVVDDVYVGVPDIFNIKYPSELRGPDYVGTNVNFEVSWESKNTDYIRLFSGEGYMQLPSAGKQELNVQTMLNLANGNYSENESTISFQLKLVPYNVSGKETVVGKDEIITVKFNKGRLTIPRNVALNRISEAFKYQIDNIEVDGDSSKYLTHLLHFGSGDNKIITTWTGSEGSIIAKLYEPLATSIEENQLVWISKLQSNPVIETSTIVGELKDYCPPLKGPNFSLEPDNGIGYKVFDDLLATGSLTSTDLVNRFAESVGIDTTKINVQYVSGSNYMFENFTNFSSAEERVNNFLYKVELIESYEDRYDALAKPNLSNSNWTGSASVISEATKLIDYTNQIKKGFDGFEYFLYNDSSSSLSYPKLNGVPKSSTDTEVKAWYEVIVSEAEVYDRENPNYLVNNLPEYLRDDYESKDFLSFLDMMGHHFDVIWTYINGLNQNKILEHKPVKGMMDKMVYHMLESMGWEGKRAFDSQFLWEYAFGKNKDGSQKYGMSLSDANDEVWRRILNNLPYLLKHKGTGRAMKAIMACYGIPQSMLTIMEFGGPQDPTGGGVTKFTFDDRTAAIRLDENSSVKIPWHTTPSTLDFPNCVEFRIRPSSSIDTVATLISGSEFTLDLIQTTGSFYKLELNFGGNDSTSTYFVTSGLNVPYVDITYAWGPELKTGSLDFPLSTEHYSNVVINRHNYAGSTSLYEVWLGTSDGERIITSVSMSILYNDNQWDTGSTSNLVVGGDGYSGELDEFRLWKVPLQRSKFDNHTLFPDAINGNSYTASTADLLFRLDFEYPKDRTSDNNIKNVSISTEYGEIYAYAQNFYSASAYPYQYQPYDRTVTANVPSLGFSYGNKIRFENQYTLAGQSLFNEQTNQQITGVDLSYKTRVTQKAFDRAPIDSSRLGLFFSPIKELNMDILKTFGDFNIDNYIGNPGDEYKDKYSELETLRNYYFERLDRNINEYIQLVRYIDKSLFDVLTDMAPARAKVSKGLLIEPHFLERNKTRWDKPVSERNDYDTFIAIDDNNSIESTYEVKEAYLNLEDRATLSYELNNYEAVINLEETTIETETPFYDTLIELLPEDIAEATAPMYDVAIDVPTGETVSGEAESFKSEQIGMDKNSLANLGFGLYGNGGRTKVTVFDDVFGNTTSSIQNVFLTKNQSVIKVPTQIEGYPANGALPGQQVKYTDIEVVKYNYKVSIVPLTQTVSIGGDVTEVVALNGYFPTHYRFTNNLGEGLQRSFWKGSQQTAATTPDGLDPVETFTTNPNILRVAKTGRGSGEPILEVD